MTIDLPLVVCGEVNDDLTDGHVFDYGNGTTVRIPRLRPEDIDRIVASKAAITAELTALSMFETTEFLSEVGRVWMDQSAESYKLLIERVPPVVGYAREMIVSDVFMMAEYMRFRTYLYDQFEADLGHELIMDEWIPVQASYVKAFPAGTILHWLVGNIPLAAIYSVIRSIATRNQTIAKLPSRDPVSATALALAFVEVDPAHPITRSVTTAYWQRDELEVAEPLFDIADVVCTWGGSDAVKSVRQTARTRSRLVEFGPRWSAAAIDLDHVADDDLDGLSARLVSDVCFYDQEACLSAQQLFVVGDWSRLAPSLERALDAFDDRMPVVTTSIDLHAHVESCTREWIYRGAEVEAKKPWRIVFTHDPIPEHPLCRTLFVRQLDRLADAVRFFDESLQTVSVYPWTASVDLRETYARAGADRLVELGFTRHVRHGYTHDGMRTLNSFVRLVSHERPARGRHFYKYGDPTIEGVEQLLFVVPDQAGTGVRADGGGPG